LAFDLDHQLGFTAPARRENRPARSTRLWCNDSPSSFDSGHGNLDRAPASFDRGLCSLTRRLPNLSGMPDSFDRAPAGLIGRANSFDHPTASLDRTDESFDQVTDRLIWLRYGVISRLGV